MISKQRLWIVISFVAGHALVVFSPAGPDSRAATLCIILAEIAASFVCFQTAGKTSGESRVHWLLLGSSVLLAPFAASVFNRAEIIGEADSESIRDYVMLLKAAYGAVLLFAISAVFDSRVARSIRIISILLSLTAGGLFFSIAHTAVLMHNSNRPGDLLFFTRMFEVIAVFIAMIATLQIAASDRREMRSFFFAASVFLLSFIIFPEIRIELRLHLRIVSSSLFIMPPYLLLFLLAGQEPPRVIRDWKPSELVFAILRHAGIFCVCLGLLVSGLVISKVYFGLGATAALFAIFSYYLLSVITRYQGFRSGEALRAANQRLGALAEIDGLTGVANRRVFDERLQSELTAAQRSGQPVSLLMIDVDHFKALNDSLGHLAGDSCLVRIAHAFRDALPRAGDLLTRYGGEEFAVILPFTGNLGALKVAESLHGAVTRLAIEHPASPSGRVAISIGVATAEVSDHRSPIALVHAADRALYKAKMMGRDRIESGATGGEAFTRPAPEST